MYFRYFMLETFAVLVFALYFFFKYSYSEDIMDYFGSE